MNNNRIWIILAGVVSVGILAMGWLLGVSPKLDEMNQANEQRATVDDQNLLHEARIAALKKQFETIDELREDLSELQVALPPGDELSTFLGQLHELETTSGVILTRFAASDGQTYVPAAGATLDPLVTIENFVPISIDLTVTGTRQQVINFVNDLQYGKRLFLINKLTVAQDENELVEVEGGEPQSKYIGNISGFVYVLVDPASPPPAPTPVGSLDSTNSPTPSPSP